MLYLEEISSWKDNIRSFNCPSIFLLYTNFYANGTKFLKEPSLKITHDIEMILDNF